MKGPPPPPYVALSENNGSIRPPPYRRNVPRYHSHNESRSKSGCCLRCICCCYCLLLLFLLVLAALSFFFYIVYKPQIPNYKVQGLSVSSFEFLPDFSLSTEFIVSVRAENPNENIGFAYGTRSYVIVNYEETVLCSGKLPAFSQGSKNITVMRVVLRGKSDFGSGLQGALMENREKGKIPLLVRVKAPVSIVVGVFPMREVVVFVNCSLVVDNLSPNKKIGILSTKYNVSIAL